MTKGLRVTWRKKDSVQKAVLAVLGHGPLDRGQKIMVPEHVVEELFTSWRQETVTRRIRLSQGLTSHSVSDLYPLPKTHLLKLPGPSKRAPLAGDILYLTHNNISSISHHRVTFLTFYILWKTMSDMFSLRGGMFPLLESMQTFVTAITNGMW